MFVQGCTVVGADRGRGGGKGCRPHGLVSLPPARGQCVGLPRDGLEGAALLDKGVRHLPGIGKAGEQTDGEADAPGCEGRGPGNLSPARKIRNRL